MPYSVPATQNLGDQTYTITNVIQLMSGANPPANIAFPMLGNPVGATTNLGVNQGAAIQWAPADAVTRAIGLITCASVCYVNADNGEAYVYHANTGHVTNPNFLTAMGAIHAAAPYDSVYIAYAHLGNTDQGYQDTLTDFVTWGIPTNNIVEITNLFIGQFGLNNNLQLGY